MDREQLIAELGERILALPRPHPTRVGIDGVDAAGKTTLAGELAAVVADSGRQVVTSGVDRFHNPAVVRRARGPLSPEGYYRDSFDHDRLVEVLLAPLGPGGSREYRTAVFEYRVDRPVDSPLERAEPDAVLIFEGVFLHTPRLREHWDLSVFVDARFEVTLPRAVRRDLQRDPYSDADEVRDQCRRRYIPGQQLYLAECRPDELADWVVGNDDFASPDLYHNAP